MAQYLVVEFLVFALGQDAAQTLVVCLDRLHGLDDGLGAVRAVWKGDELVELRLGLQEDRAFLGEVFLGLRSGLAAALGEIGIDIDRFFNRQKSAVGVPQEDQPHDRHKVLVAGVVRVGTQGVRSFPEAFFDGFNLFQLGQFPFLRSSLSTISKCLYKYNFHQLLSI
ncbi:MAG: hypothetical protein WCW68_07780 [Methanothrix sp.]